MLKKEGIIFLVTYSAAAPAVPFCLKGSVFVSQKANGALDGQITSEKTRSAVQPRSLSFRFTRQVT